MDNTSPSLAASGKRAKNKTLAAWLAILGGPLGLHRFYLHGWLDPWGWLHPIPTALGLWGWERMQHHGQDDVLSWWLLPLLGMVIAVCCLTAILCALTATPRWNMRHNPQWPSDNAAGATNWLTVAALVAALMLGTIGLMSSLAFSFQHYFESQVEQGLQISQ